MANFEAFEQFLKEATTPGPNRTLPGVVVAAVDANGITYSHSAGTQSVDPDSPLLSKPFSLDTTMWIASCTKLLTSLSALQCIERGLLSADGDIGEVIPELRKMPILTGFKDEDGVEVPQFRENTTPITLRHLLSHSSGLAYALFDPELVKVFKYKGITPGPGADTSYPDIFAGCLKFAPGTGWSYGVGIDIAGLAITRVTGLSLQDYFTREFFVPLGMTATSFRPSASIKAARADMSVRVDGTIAPSPTRIYSDDVQTDAGGAGLWSCARDYTKILSAVLRTPSPLFRNPQTLEMAFTPCLSAGSRSALNTIIFSPYPGNEHGEIGAMFHGGTLPTTGLEVDYSMAGLCILGGLEGKRGGEGKAVSWGGLPNLIWVLDRERGRGAFYGSQLLPPGDRLSGQAFGRFEALVMGGEGAKL